MTLLERPPASQATENAGAESGDRVRRRLLAAALTIGFVLQAPLYFARPSLLLDEARLALNITSRSWWALTRPLDYDQTAPLLFLWLSKLATVIGGVNEYALRALPYAAGAALPLLVYLVGRRVFDRQAAILAALLAGVSPVIIQYVRQVKPYTLDAAVALGLFWLALDWMDDPRSARRRWCFGAAATVAVWASAPALFVIAGAFVVLWLAPLHSRPPRVWLLSTAAIVAGSCVAAYLWIYRPAAQNPYMQQFWDGSLLTLWRPGAVARVWQGTREVMWQTFAGGSTEPPLPPAHERLVNTVTLALLVLMTAGLTSFARRRGWIAPALLMAPVAIAYIASFVGSYPIAARVTLFAVPSLILAVAAGAIWLLSALRQRFRAVGAAAFVVTMLALALPRDVQMSLHPRSFEDVRSAVAEYERRAAASGEAIYVFAAALPAWTFYTTDWRAPNRERLARMAALGTSGGAAFENAPSRGRAIQPAEGEELVYETVRGRELIGLFHGAQWRSGIGLVQPNPDTNWTTHEARRIRVVAEADGSAWVLLAHTFGVEHFLIPAVGLCMDHAYRSEAVLLVRFVPPGRPCGRQTTESAWTGGSSADGE